MSSFTKILKNPKTGKMQKAFCIDDYYGSHAYGYGFPLDGSDADFSINRKKCDWFNEEELKNT